MPSPAGLTSWRSLRLVREARHLAACSKLFWFTECVSPLAWTALAGVDTHDMAATLRALQQGFLGFQTVTCPAAVVRTLLNAAVQEGWVYV